MTNIVYNMDCMDGMKEYPDGYFDLAVVDPPYGIEKAVKATSRIQKYGDVHMANDMKPTREYFEELMRVSKNQIIWGYNHLSDMLPKTKEFIFWYKHQTVETYSDGELAWTSFKKTAKCFDYAYAGFVGGMRRGSTPCRNRWHYTGGSIKNMQSRGTKSLIRTWGAGPAEGRPMRRGLISWDLKLNRNTSDGRKKRSKSLQHSRVCLQMNKNGGGSDNGKIDRV